MKIRFTKAYKVPGVDGRAFSVGDEIDMPDDSARIFVDSGVAENISGGAKPPRKPKAIGKPTGR